ncbi:MAG TPA: hypothetical protein VHU84_03800, partial [Lacipirellulaceae bacterium]|nr:hypothetical protein [Lacipirellulaceae bacterium]
MSCSVVKQVKYCRCLVFFVLGSTLLAFTTSSRAALIVDDSWADGGRNDGADPLDTNWWTSTTSSAIEVSVGSLGLVSGSSGRGIHGTFSPQTLTNVGDSLKATFTFTTPATVGTGATAAFKVGLFDTNGNAGLAADLSASSTTPNPIYDPLPGYMMDYDVEASGANIQFREKSPVPGSTGQLLGTTTGFVNLTSGGNSYVFAPNTAYTGTYSITKTAAGFDLTGSLSDASGVLSTFTSSDTTPSTSTFDLIGFHVNASIFGSSNTVNTANNGIDFSNIKIELTSVPEPSTLLLSAINL